MNYRFILLWTLFCYSISAKSQNLTQSIRGTVSDKDSKAPLPGANVVIINEDPFRGTVSDASGNFKLDNVKVGRHTIRISYLGYKDIIINDLIVNSAKEVVISPEMEESIVQAKEIVITAEHQKDKPLNEMSMVSTRTFTIDEANRYAGSWGDPSRMVSNFAGVTGGNDQRNDIVVRGNSPLGMLWKLEGMDIPSPNHFSTSGSSGGAISILNNNTLENSDFMTGAFASEYGNAISGVFDLRMRKGNNEKHEYLAQVGAAGFELGAEGPFVQGKKASYLINYRYSAFGLMGKLGFFDFVGSVPYYQDISFKVFIPYKKGNLTLFGLGGKSSITFEEGKDTSKWRADESQMIWRRSESRMGVAGISWMHFLSEKTFLKAGFVSSYSESDYQEDSTDFSFKRHRQFYTDFGEGSHTASVSINSKLSSRNTIKAGVSGSHLFFNFNTERQFYVPVNYLERVIKFSGGSDLMQSFVQWKYKLRENLTFLAGAHYLHYFLNGREALEPRTSLKWDFSKKQSLSLGYGMHSRLLPSGVYFGEVIHPDGSVSRENKALDFVKATHIVLGYDHLLSQNLRFKMEVYYQDLYKAPVLRDTLSYFSGLNSGADYENITSTKALASKGTGRNYGIEITFERFYSKGYYFLMTTSLFDSKYRGSDGVERNTTFNSNYAFNILGGKEFKVGKEKNNVIAVNMTYVTLGGRREVPIDINASRLADEAVYIYSQAYTEKMKDYIRLDGRISYRQNRKKYSHEIALDIRNMMNHRNVFLKYYNSHTASVESLYQVGFFPVLFYRIEF